MVAGKYYIPQASCFRCGELKSELAAYRWIPVSERLPETTECVLACNPNLTAYVGRDAYLPKKGRWESGCEYTHWMPIPPLPEKGAKT